MDYQVYKPCDELAPFIKCYWTLEGPEEAHPPKQTIVPDGCMEMIFHYKDLYRQYLSESEFIVQPRCFVFGQMSNPIKIQPTGETGIFSVRFHHEGFMPLSTLPIREMENKAISLQCLFGEEGKQLAIEVLEGESTQKRIEIAEAFIQKRLCSHTAMDSILKRTVETILTANGQLPIEVLTEKMKINRRQLERKFSAAIGLSPKKLSKTIRLQTTLKLLLSDQYSNLTDLTYQGDYYDQAHFIKEFKAFTGFTPREFYGDGIKMSSLFYGKNG